MRGEIHLCSMYMYVLKESLNLEKRHYIYTVGGKGLFREKWLLSREQDHI